MKAKSVVAFVVFNPLVVPYSLSLSIYIYMYIDR